MPLTCYYISFQSLKKTRLFSLFSYVDYRFFDQLLTRCSTSLWLQSNFNSLIGVSRKKCYWILSILNGVVWLLSTKQMGSLDVWYQPQTKVWSFGNNALLLQHGTFLKCIFFMVIFLFINRPPKSIFNRTLFDRPTTFLSLRFD